MPATVYLYLFEGLSDWEIGYLTPGITSSPFLKAPNQHEIKTFSDSGQPIRTAGGLKITADLSLDQVTSHNAALLVLPGGAAWEHSSMEPIIHLAQTFHQANVPIAAICGATLGLARAGILDSVRHTSNSASYLASTGYLGADHYTNALAASDQGVITAAGTAPLEFAKEVFEVLDFYEPDVLNRWYRLFSERSEEAFGQLLQAAGYV